MIAPRMRSGLIKKTKAYLSELRGFMAGRLEASYVPVSDD